MASTSLLIQNAIDLAMSKGMLIRPSTQSEACTHIPFTLFPNTIPKTEFETIKAIQPHINNLMFLASRDADFVLTSLKTVAETDEFTKKWMDIFKEANSCTTKSAIQFGVLRSDYMLDYNSSSGQTPFAPKQVEINTFACAASAVAGNSLRFVHCKMLKEANRRKDVSNMPENNPLSEISKSFVEAWKAYGNHNAVITFVVSEISEPEPYVIDQRAIEYKIYSLDDAITVRRHTFEDIISNGRLGDDGTLYIGENEVAIVYFRHGYRPTHYPTQKHWDARLLIEKSRAIKCPHIGLQLLGCKKFQEIFAKPGTVERFLEDKEAAASIRKTFAGFYSLEMNSEGDEAVKKALKSPDDFVMKPQREGGGGHNLQGEDIVRCLNEIGCSNKRCAYVLMDKIRPKSYKNYLIRQGIATETEAIHELGIFGVILGKEKDLVANYCAGHLLRSKPKDVASGGIMVGRGAYSSPLLE